MPTYQIYFDTEDGREPGFNVDIAIDEVIGDVLPDILWNLEESGHRLKGTKDGGGYPVVIWQGAPLDLLITLSTQGVKPNDVLRVALRPKQPPPPDFLLQLQRDQQLYDVNCKEELLEGDEIIVGNTTLRLHIRKHRRRLGEGPTGNGRDHQGRSFQQSVYFMALVGGIAGLICWFIASWLPFFLTVKTATVDVVNLTILGAIIGGLTVGFSDRWLGDHVNFRWVMMGILVGSLGGFIGGIISSPIRTGLGEGLRWLASPLLWAIGGGLIGCGICLRWYSVTRIRVLHGLLGGMFGGLIGGIVFWFLPYLGIGADISQALGFVLTGVGITSGISLAPILLRQGVLEFAGSDDLKVSAKYEERGKQWEIHEGGRYVIGNLSPSKTRTIFTPAVQIFIPDELVVGRHAILTSKEGRYFIELHPEWEKTCRDEASRAQAAI